MEIHHRAKIEDRMWAALCTEPRFDPVRDTVYAAVDRTIATLSGQVGNIAVKKRILKRIATLSELTGLVDRLRVTRVRRMDDTELGAVLTDALSNESILAECTLQQHWNGLADTVREGLDGHGTIAIAVDNGVVTLAGEVPSLPHKQLAGLLAWWMPGSRDVINDLGEMVPARDMDSELIRAVRMALEKDPFVDASRIRVSARDAAIMMQGFVPTDSEREMAEFDAWYVFGVDRVDNLIELRP